MVLQDLLKQKNLTIYRLSKNSGIPYATLNDIINGKANLEKCSAETVYKLARELDITMEELLAPYLERRSSFELFKSNVCQHVKVVGDINFIVEILEKDPVREYYDKSWYPESFYLLAMVDYLSRINDVPLCKEYEDIRCQRLQDTIYPESILAITSVSQNDSAKKETEKEAIPEFMRFNIVESDIRNVI